MTGEFIVPNLRRARHALRLSQTAVAKHLGLSRQTFWGAESGRRAITVDELLKLADLYRVPVELLLRPQTEPTRDDCVRVKRRTDTPGDRALDAQDSAEIARFINALRAERRRSRSHSTSGMDLGPGPFRPLAKVADDLRTRLALTRSPVNVYKAFAHDDVRVRVTALTGISGAFIPASDDHRAGVLINANQPPDRQRYSAAHELGHSILGHAGAYEQRIVSPLGRRFSPREVEADCFASELLVPLRLVQEEIGRLPGSEPLEAAVHALADRFLVSYRAMIHRLADLNLVTATQKDQVLRSRRADRVAGLTVKRRGTTAFDARALSGMCGKTFAPETLQDPDGVRLLQEVAFTEYAGRVPECERSDSPDDVYEKVALWVAESYPLPSALAAH